MKYSEEQFAKAIALYREWNEKINVVSRKDIDNIFSHHFLHSLAIAEYLERTGESMEGCTVLDVGTGGGFPGIPLASVLPDTHFTLCDSIGKKIKVAASVASGLGLKNVECVNCRAEELRPVSVGKSGHKPDGPVGSDGSVVSVRSMGFRESGQEKFDWVVSRAVTSLENFYPWVKGSFRKGILYLKGGDINTEIAAMCSKFDINPAKISVWPIREWLDDEYFSEKYVIHISNPE